MSHCIRCGGELPSAGAECPECRIAFKDVLEDSAFLDDDEGDEEFAPAPPNKRVSRFDRYLDESPVFAGQDDAAPVREPLLRDRRPPAPVPAPDPVPQPVAESAPDPILGSGQEPAWEPTPEPVWDSTAEPLPEPGPVSELENPSEIEAQFAARFAALFENGPQPADEPQPAAEVEPVTEPEPIVEPVAHVEPEPVTEPIAEVEPVAEVVAHVEPEPEPVAEPIAEPEPVAEPVAEVEPVTEPEPIVEPVAHVEPEPVTGPVAHIDPVAEPAPAVADEPLAEVEAEFEARFAALFENEPEPAPEATLQAEPESQTIYVDADDPLATAEEPVEETSDVDESIAAPVNVVVVLPASDPIGPPEPESLPAPAQPVEEPDPEPVAPVVDEASVVEPTPVMQPVVEPTAPAVPAIVQPIAAIPVLATPVQDPDVHTGPTRIKLTPRFELHSAPAEGSPAIHVLLDIEPSGAPLVTGVDGPLAHVILALDLSASMNDPRKYPVLTRAIENMLEDLRNIHEGDVLISLVVFAYGAEILLRAQPASQLDAREVLGQIDRSPLRFSRYTDIVGALTRAGRIALDSHRAMPRVPIRMYVLTDGRPQDIKGARRKMGQIRKIPVDVHGLGFGDDADLDVLQDLISGGRGGTVKHVRSETLSSAFEQIAKVAKRVVAKRALLDVELKGGAVGGASYRFRPARHSYGKRAFENGQLFHTDLGTLESGRRYSMLFQLRLPPAQGEETEIGRVTLRIPGEGGPVTFEHLLFITRHAGSEMPAPDEIVLEARHVVEAVGAADPKAQLKALHARRRLYVEERRDPYIIELIDRAIGQMETKGSLDALSNGERAALQSHTQSIVGTGA